MSELTAPGRLSLATPFTACLPVQAPGSRGVAVRRTPLLISVGLHLGLLVLGAAFWRGQESLEVPPAPRVRVTMSSRPQLAAARAPAAASATPAPARTAPRPALAPPRPVPTKKERAPTPEPASAEPAAPDAGAAVAFEETPGGSGQELADSLGEASVGGAGASVEGSAPPPAISAQQRQLYLERYLQEIFRSRIAARFRYPERAERLGIEGLVVVMASIEATGRLSSATTVGSCPHRVLCEAAERTVLEAAPYPPPPAELGGAIRVAVPFQYRLE